MSLNNAEVVKRTAITHVYNWAEGMSIRRHNLGLEQELSDWSVRVVQAHLPAWKLILGTLDYCEASDCEEVLTEFLLEAHHVLSIEFNAAAVAHPRPDGRVRPIDAITLRELQEPVAEYRQKSLPAKRGFAQDLLRWDCDREPLEPAGHIFERAVRGMPCFYCALERLGATE